MYFIIYWKFLAKIDVWRITFSKLLLNPICLIRQAVTFHCHLCCTTSLDKNRITHKYNNDCLTKWWDSNYLEVSNKIMYFIKCSFKKTFVFLFIYTFLIFNQTNNKCLTHELNKTFWDPVFGRVTYSGNSYLKSPIIISYFFSM